MYMYPLEVYFSGNGDLCLSQKEEHQDITNTITINPDQIDLLIKWLNGAKKENHVKTAHD